MFTKTESGDKILYCLTEEDAQFVAKKQFKTHLTEDELYVVRKCLEYGFEDWDIVMKTAIQQVLTERGVRSCD